MKTIYTLLILLLTVTFANAQSNNGSVEALTNNTVAVSEINNEVTTDVNEVLLIDANQVKESVARSASDIRVYLNRERNVDNISLLFPNINKQKSA